MKFTKNAMVALCATTSILANGFNTFAFAANETELNIVAWPGYVERGESDKGYDWVTVLKKKPAAKSTLRPPLLLTKW